MKLIIAGSRNLTVSLGELNALTKHYGLNPKEIVSGCAKGIDTCGESFGYTKAITVTKFPADWNLHGLAAGPIRNRQMADYADGLLLIWDGTSKGSANMKAEMLKLGKPVYEAIIEEKK